MAGTLKSSHCSSASGWWRVTWPEWITRQTGAQLCTVAENTKHRTLPQCWFKVYDVGPTLNQHLVSVSFFLGRDIGLEKMASRNGPLRSDTRGNCRQWNVVILTASLVTTRFPANTKRPPHVGLILGQRHRPRCPSIKSTWWPNVKQTLGEHLMFIGWTYWFLAVQYWV